MKKILLTIAAMLAVVGMNAQEVMNVELSDGRTMGFKVKDVGKVSFVPAGVSEDDAINSLHTFLMHIDQCNNSLNSYFNASNFKSLNSSLSRLFRLSLFNDSVSTKLRNRLKTQIDANMVKLDTVNSGFCAQLKTKGYQYFTSYKFQNVHFTYNMQTKSWDVTEAKNDIQISYREADSTLITITITPQTDNYTASMKLNVEQLSTPSKNKVYYQILVCDDYKVVLTRGNETLASGDVINNNPISYYDRVMTNGLKYSLNVGDYNLSYDKSLTDNTGLNAKHVVSMSKGGTNVLSVNFNSMIDGLRMDYKDINMDIFGKIQLKSCLLDYYNSLSYFRSANNSDDSTEIALYADSLNQNITTTMYYDNIDTKVADFKFVSDTNCTDYYQLVPLVRFPGNVNWFSFYDAVSLKELGGILELFSSFSRDVFFEFLSLTNRIEKAMVME